MTAQSLQTRSLKDLAKLARRRGVNGWHSMSKDQLVRALLRAGGKPPLRIAAKPPLRVAAKPPLRVAAKPAAKKTLPVSRAGAAKRTAARRPALAARVGSVRHGAVRSDPRLLKRLEQSKVRLMRAKILSEPSDARIGVPTKDRLVVMVRGPYWLHAYWELTPQGIVRAQAALGEQWHAARPVLRLIEVSSASASIASGRVVRDIQIHGGVKNWYVDVNNPPHSYRMEIGYLAQNGRFFSLARSNTVTTPPSSTGEKLDNHWSDVVENCDKIYAMSGGYSPEVNSSELQEVLEERLRRPVGTSIGRRYGVAADSLLPRDHTVRFNVEAEMVVHGMTHPDANVTLQGAPIKLRPDGSFSVRLDMPNRRQVIPIVASTRDGASQRTIVLAIERNTKVMEPINREPSE